jgi:protein-tyrosine phosphatase
MNQILPHGLWIGHAGDDQNFRRLFDLGVEAVVELAVEEPPTVLPRELISCRFPLVDGLGNRIVLLSLAIHTLAALLRARVPTLVCCGGGMSRSPAVAAAALSVAFGEAPEECLKAVVLHHPGDVSPGLWNEITQVLATARPA